MAKTKISEFSSTPANNTDIDSINIAEGCAPSGINDAIRELMAQLKDFQTGAQGDSFNGPIGTSTAAAGAFTTLSATGAITSTLATGTAPLVIASTTKVANLNVDLLDGADWASPAALGSTTPAAVSATTLSASSTVTLSGGTANGVAYLNGSKVVTSGSALTFDGTNLSNTRSVATAFSGTNSATWANGIVLTNTATPATGVSSLLVFQGTSNVNSVFGVTQNSSGFGDFVWAGYSGSFSEQMRLTSTGLGIGTSSPQTKLHVAQSASGVLFGQDSTTANIIGTNAAGTSSQGLFLKGFPLTFTGSGGGGTAQMTLNGDGNLGLGVTPSAWATFTGLQVGPLGGVNIGGAAGDTFYAMNAYYNAGWKYAATGTTALMYRLHNGEHKWYNAPSGTAGNAITFTQAMTLGSNGDLLLGTTTNRLGEKLHVLGNGIVTSSAENTNMGLFGTFGSSNLIIGAFSNLPVEFRQNNTERARIDSSGNFLVGKTSADDSIGGFSYFGASKYLSLVRDNSPPLYINRLNADGAVVEFARSTTLVGTISVTTTATAYNTSSDYRLKENIQPMTGALAKVAALKPCTYKWKADGSDGEGFIAHELAEVVPQCVTGEKDAVDEDGNPKYQGIDTSFLVATLTAALQELKAEFDAYKASHP